MKLVEYSGLQQHSCETSAQARLIIPVTNIHYLIQQGLLVYLWTGATRKNRTCTSRNSCMLCWYCL